MAIIYVNVSQIGSTTQGGRKALIVSRGSGQSGAVTVAIDTTKVTLKTDVIAFLADAVQTLSDQIK